MPFRNRVEAGRRLGALVADRVHDEAVVVVALPRGGVPVGAEVARALHAPLDALVVRKLGYPPHPELALGALGEGGVCVLNEPLIHRLGVPREMVERIVTQEAAELDRRERRYRGDRPSVPVAGRTAVLVDDGLATGSSAMAAIEVLRKAGVARIVLAVPVGPVDTVVAMQALADDVVCAEQPDWMMSIGEFYDDFEQVDDDEVARILAASALGVGA